MYFFFEKFYFAYLWNNLKRKIHPSLQIPNLVVQIVHSNRLLEMDTKNVYIYKFVPMLHLAFIVQWCFTRLLGSPLQVNLSPCLQIRSAAVSYRGFPHQGCNIYPQTIVKGSPFQSIKEVVCSVAFLDRWWSLHSVLLPIDRLSSRYTKWRYC